MSTDRSGNPSEVAPRHRIGQAWALVALLLIVVGSALRELALTLEPRGTTSSVALIVAGLVVAMTVPVTLMCLGAAALRRGGLSIAAVAIGALQAIPLALLLVIAALDLSVSIDAPRRFAGALLAVLLGVVGAGLALFRQRDRWPPLATIALVLAALGSVGAALDGVLLLGPRLAAGLTPTGGLLALAAPAAITLLGVAVAARRWLPALLGAAVLIPPVIPGLLALPRVLAAGPRAWALATSLTGLGVLAAGSALVVMILILRAGPPPLRSPRRSADPDHLSAPGPML